MLVEGHTYESIAREMGYSSKGHAHNAVQRALRLTIQEPADNLRKIQLARLEEAHQVVRTIMRSEHVAHSGGKIVYMTDPDTGEEVPVIDHGPNLAAADRVTRIAERVARLTGIDEPTKFQDLTLGVVQAKIAELKAKQDADDDQGHDPDDS